MPGRNDGPLPPLVITTERASTYIVGASADGDRVPPVSCGSGTEEGRGMTGTLRETGQRRAPAPAAAVLIVVVAVLIAGAAWWFAPWHAARPVALTGLAYSDHDRTSIGFDADSPIDAMRFGLSGGGEGFDVRSVFWAGTDNVWNDGGPVRCLRPSEAIRVELRFVEVSHGSGPGGPTRVVTSLRCLE